MPEPWGFNNLVNGIIGKDQYGSPIEGTYYNQEANRYTDPFAKAMVDFANRKGKKPALDIDAMITRMANENNVEREEIIKALRGDNRLKGDPGGTFGEGELERIRSGSDW